MKPENDGEETNNDDLQPNNTSDENDGITMASVSTWLSGWYDSAKKKVVETNEFMKRDLQEFSQAVQSDATNLVAATATTMKEKLHINVDLEEASSTTRSVKNSLSNFLGNIANKVGPIRPDDNENDDESAIMGTSSGTKVLSPSEARIHAIRTDPATFCNEPDGEEEYFMWLPSFNAEEKKSEISTLMLDCSQIRSLYTKLVPSAVSHSDFWARYFFKLHQHAKAEERRAMLVERARKAHDDIEWDDEDDDPVQIRNTQEPTQSGDCQKEAPSFKNITETRNSNSPDMNVHVIAAEASQLESTGSCIEKDNSSSANPLKTDGNELQANQHLKSLAPQTETQTTTSEVKDLDDKNEQAQAMVKTPSTGESSDDWEKDFDLDMTEDEIQEALKESEAIDVNADDIGDDWDEWE